MAPRRQARLMLQAFLRTHTAAVGSSTPLTLMYDLLYSLVPSGLLVNLIAFAYSKRSPSLAIWRRIFHSG
jgi:hypothetical protein